MRESELLHHIARRSSHLHGRGAVVVGPGDDCAVLDLSAGGGLTLATVDHLVEGRHYDAARASIDQIARKAVARSVSDLAAMGGMPLCGLATGCLRDGFEHGNDLFDRMAAWAEHFGCPLVGGDIASSPGPTVLTVTVLGQADAVRGPVLRSTAGVGDLVCVTGRIGGSLASGRHLGFEPRFREGQALVKRLGPLLTSMIDISDGLGRDAARVARASGVRIEIEASRVPLNSDAGEVGEAIRAGEDYELLFTVSGDRPPRDVCGVEVSVIGRVVRGDGCVLMDENGGVHDLTDQGWDHGA